MKFKKLIFTILLSIMFIPNVFAAGSVTVTYTGDSSVVVGNTITLNLAVQNISGASDGVVSIEGNVSFDSNYLEYVSYTSASSVLPTTMNASNNYKFAGVSMTQGGITSNSSVLKLTFTAKKTGSTTITAKNLEVCDSLWCYTVTIAPKTITIKEPASSNNYLSSLSVNNGTINFNKDTTSYSVSVDSSVTSIGISATAEDSKASVSGTGTKSLNYGDNTFNVVVTAEDGSKKTYKVTVNRKDNRSNNTYLKKLSISNASINFNKDTTSYSIEVPYEVDSLNISTEVEDSKSKVSISNNNLEAEATTDVKVTVTAENGDTRTYTISVKRGKDPNKTLSTDNYLTSLTVSQGILSPVFDKEKTNYAVYLPFEVSTIEIKYEVSDTKYATVDVEGDTNLSVGNNIFKYNVTAENGDIRTYTITVVRNASLDDVELSSNTNISGIEINNGKLTTVFKNDKHVYYYKGSDLEINLTLEDENSKYQVVNIEDVYIAIIESASGEKSYYVFIPKSYNIMGAIIGFIFGGLLGACAMLLINKKGIKIGKRG